MRAAPGEDRLPEPARRVDDHVRDLVGRQADQARLPVLAELQTTEVRLDDVVEHPLAAAHHDQLAKRAGHLAVTILLGVVEQDLRAVGVEALARQRVRQAASRPDGPAPASTDGGVSDGLQRGRPLSAAVDAVGRSVTIQSRSGRRRRGRCR